MPNLTNEEFRAVAAAMDHGDTMSAADRELVVRWAERARVHGAALDLVLAGKLQLAVEDGEVAFLTPT